MANSPHIYKILTENNNPSFAEIRTVAAKNITKVLLETRIRRGITRPELGEASGIHYRSFENWELEHTSPRSFDLEVWANSLGYDLFFLLVPKVPSE